MLSAEKMAKDLQSFGIKVTSFEESRKPRYIDGEVLLENNLSVQVGIDYACLCVVNNDDIEYLLEVEDIYKEMDFAVEVANFLKKRIN